MNRVHQAKQWILSRTVREQTLVVVLALAASLVWLFSGLKHVKRSYADWQLSRQEHANQQLWLDRQSEIETKAAEAVKNLDPARTYDSTKLVATVTTLAAQASLTPSIDPPHTERTPQFNYHTVRVNFRRATLPSLLKFYEQFAKLAPYLNLEQITVQTDRNTPGQLGVTLQISAPQIANQASD